MKPQEFTTANNRRLSEDTEKKKFRFLNSSLNSEWLLLFKKEFPFFYVKLFSVFSVVNF